MIRLVSKLEEKENPDRIKPMVSISLDALQLKIRNLEQQLQADQSLDPQQLQTKYLGKRGLFNTLAKDMRHVAPQDKKAAGQVLNAFKHSLQTRLGQLSVNQSA